ncbi:MAG: transporter substrate-binding domain-containing protein [Gemmatimonadetes bacterium]|nr:transporter substrate-binding domain-containing protein [Gemmatimonadota bacterium]
MRRRLPVWWIVLTLVPVAVVVVDAVADGRAEYGYLWGPLAASLTRGRSDVVVEKAFQPPELWSFAMAVRQGDGELRQAVNRGIREMVQGGDLAGILARYGVPYYPPCSSADTGSACGKGGQEVATLGAATGSPRH